MILRLILLSYSRILTVEAARPALKAMISPTSFPGSLFSAAIVVEKSLFSTTMEAEKRDPGNEVVISRTVGSKSFRAESV